jgi:membrane associated rhomboid family serine protease
VSADESGETIVRVTADLSLAHEWSVVLAASGLAFRIEETSSGWVLIVSAPDMASAAGILRAYEDENRPAVPAAAPFRYTETWIGSVVAAFLVGFFAITGPWEPGVAWFERGSASAERILSGEWWRTVTALTLHQDLVHLVGNAIACILLVTAVGRSLGPGVACWLVLQAGALGNTLTALAHTTHHVAVGASTASFGAIGILAGLQFVRRRRAGTLEGRAWMVIAASLALLGLLGSGLHSDLLAHLFGLLTGGALGVMAALGLHRVPGPRIQWLLAVLAATAVAWCWRLAFAAM